MVAVGVDACFRQALRRSDNNKSGQVEESVGLEGQVAAGVEEEEVAGERVAGERVADSLCRCTQVRLRR